MIIYELIVYIFILKKKNVYIFENQKIKSNYGFDYFYIFGIVVIEFRNYLNIIIILFFFVCYKLYIIYYILV